MSAALPPVTARCADCGHAASGRTVGAAEAGLLAHVAHAHTAEGKVPRG